MTPVRRSVSISLLAMLLSLTAAAQPAAQEATKAPTFKPEELEQIVAPVALYPDAVLAQVFMASTYPLEIVQAARWSKEHPDVKGDALEAEMQKQSWDPSVKSLTTFPDVLAMMNEKLDWTQKLGDAFLAQQKDVMDAVQRLRAKAKAEGNLESSKEQVVRTEAAPAGASTSTIIYVEPADPQVVYVPTYNPTVVYGAWPYPAYPPYYYYPPGYVAATSFFSFTFGVAVGSALWGNCNWGHSDIDIDVNRQNNFNNINTGDRGNGNRGNQKWEHNSEHRKGAQYRDSATQQKYGKASDRQAQQSREQYRGRADEAAQALISAVRDGKTRGMLEVLGAEAKPVIDSGDAVQDANGRAVFLQAYDAESSLLQEGEGRVVLQVGADKWPFPFPIVADDGKWRFDSSEGVEEVVNRRVGDNELRTIQACLAFVDAEREYYERNPENDPLLHYARRLPSSEGKRDGLYFEVNPGEPESPLGIGFANARDEGCFAEGAPRPQPFHGYVYRVLTAQGADAAGGAYDYLAGDKMIGGFALIAYPADYGNSGVMTFIVNHDGIVFSRDLGAETARAAAAITGFNPDSSWKREASI